MHHILFVCTGNTCRSPMAEGFMRKLASERGVDVEVRSAGVAAVDGMSVSRHADAVLKDHNIHEQLLSSSLTGATIHWADLILTLTGSHKQHVIRNFPESAGKVYTLKEYAENDHKVLRDLKELDSLYATIEMNRSLGEEVNPADRQRLIEIQQRIPSFDIVDPFGGSRDDYEVAAADIRNALEKLLDKIQAYRTQ
ncbi:low molecular weight protein arginine phosphatase [Paenibacillus sp. PsM32]|uniref:Low molecular weight protein arginine phosphatase n=2 Tax=Paenibacillus TaxID=44249 RepID=A0ABW4V249_9BACL|nr:MULTISPECIES: low molecular weight protein arginine phosphatase [Paenibacillus]MDN4620330.1 low molecular weight protein arginine phosphatase [Paenibacillus sp. PsM32]MDQ1235928.1 protein-tyrosine-phosphatase [Paenibacillus sp. SORGH_AS_0306]MDR6112978.1 protein-tyrosine-phosphatase [Paenibacillus sp. SORGH_AS_0338]WCT55416.1 low molecular weight protein arginine phosphatase [Paenibacillus kyungheensis]WDF51430.1 low molecular weight protein arginine phosphatase [Paenibacillus sp. KACC 2127